MAKCIDAGKASHISKKPAQAAGLFTLKEKEEQIASLWGSVTQHHLYPVISQAMFKFIVRRRQLWVPTFLGWVLLFVLITIACVIGGRCIYSFLSSNEPAPAARLLVVEGWMDERGLDQAVIAFRAGRYERVITTGGPIEAWPEMLGNTDYADIAARYLKTHGLENVDVIAVATPASAQERTFLSAVKVREWLAGQGIRVDAIDVFSSGVHARRSHMLYRMAFGPDVAVGILAGRPSEYNPTHWWKTSAGAKSVMGETISLVWTVCCFYPPQPGSREEMWGESVPR